MDCKLISKVHLLVRALASICNAFFTPLLKDSPQNDLIESREHLSNELVQQAEELKSGWTKSSFDNIQRFLPEDLKSESIRNWIVGPYALTLCVPYIKHSTCRENYDSSKDSKMRSRLLGLRVVLALFQIQNTTQLSWSSAIDALGTE
jgi:hypothetical protein